MEYEQYLQWKWIYEYSKVESKIIFGIIPYLSNKCSDIDWLVIWEEKFLSMMIRWLFFEIQKKWNTYVWYSIEDYFILNKYT